MKYIANQDIDKFKKGDEVPEELAKVWMNMYVKSPVDEEKQSKSTKPKVIPKQESKEKSVVDSIKDTLSGVNKKSKE